jgi:hypothetical protein
MTDSAVFDGSVGEPLAPLADTQPASRVSRLIQPYNCEINAVTTLL